MARWPSLLLAAAAMLAAPAALWAQAAGKPQAEPESVVEPARVIAAMDVCRQAPPDYAGAFRHAREQGFGDLPPEVRARIPVETLVRQDVRLRVSGPSSLTGSGGNCTVYADIRQGYSYDELIATLTALFGQPGVQGDGETMSWRVDGRYISASLSDDSLTIFVGFPDLTPEQVAAARAERQARDAEALARITAATRVSPAADIAEAATLCLAALDGSRIDTASLERAGWVRDAASPQTYSRPGNDASIFAGGRQCVVDAYGENAGSFDAIKDSIETQLRARFGREVRLAASTGNAGSFSRGQGFVVGTRIGILSSESRQNGLSIRFTVMSLG